MKSKLSTTIFRQLFHIVFVECPQIKSREFNWNFITTKMPTQSASQENISSNHGDLFQESNEDTFPQYQQQEQHPSSPCTLSLYKNSDELEELVEETQNCSEQDFDQLLSSMPADENTSTFEDYFLPNLFVESPKAEVETHSTIAASSEQPLYMNPLEISRISPLEFGMERRDRLLPQLTQVRGIQRPNRMRTILTKRCKDENCPFGQHNINPYNPILQIISTKCACGQAFQFFQNNRWKCSSSIKTGSE
jgi:hypothetical protein